MRESHAECVRVGMSANAALKSRLKMFATNFRDVDDSVLSKY